MLESINDMTINAENYAKLYSVQKLIESAEQYHEHEAENKANPVIKEVFDPSLEFFELQYAAGVFGNPKIGADQILSILSLGSTIASLALGVSIPPWISTSLEAVNLAKIIQDRGRKALVDIRFTLQDKIGAFERIFGDITLDAEQHCINILKESHYHYSWESEKEFNNNIEKTCKIAICLLESRLPEGQELAVDSINNYLLKLPTNYFKKYNQRTIEECAFALSLASKALELGVPDGIEKLANGALDWLKHYREERNLSWWGIRQAERKMVTVYNAICDAKKHDLIKKSEESFWLQEPWEYFEDVLKLYDNFQISGLPEETGGRVNTIATSYAIRVFRGQGKLEIAKSLERHLVDLNERNAWPFEKGDFNEVNATCIAMDALKGIPEKETSRVIKNGTRWLCAVLPQIRIKKENSFKYKLIAANGILGLSAYSALK
jgi:hypothetical protein